MKLRLHISFDDFVSPDSFLIVQFSAAQQCRPSVDRRQRRSKLVRQNGEKLIFRPVGFTKVFFGFLGFGNVDNCADKPDGHSIRMLVFESHQPFLLHPLQSPMDDHAIFNVVISKRFRMQRASDGLPNPFAIVRVDQTYEELKARAAPGRQAENNSGACVQCEDIGRQIPVPGPQLRYFRCKTQCFLAIAQCFFRALSLDPLSDIGGNGRKIVQKTFRQLVPGEDCHNSDDFITQH